MYRLNRERKALFKENEAASYLMNQRIKVVFLILAALVAVSIYLDELKAIKCSQRQTEPIKVTITPMKTVSTLAKRETTCESDSLLKDVSVLLKEAMRRIGQMNCEKSNNQVSTNGGWCSKISGRNSPEHKTDEILLAALSHFLVNKTVASFGDGPGVYKELILQMGQVKSYDAFDGAPYVKETTNNQVEFLDLSVPIYHLKQFDWVLSLEVAEHIPAQFEHVYIDNLARHAKEGIILSWAKPGQNGHSHINNRDSDYVLARMSDRGFKRDEKASSEFKNSTKFVWFRDNLNVYRRVDQVA
jgi:hypothetical protein